MNWRVLCVDDDREVASTVAEFFTAWEDENPYGTFVVEVEPDFTKAIERLKDERFDLVTLDLHGSNDPEPIKIDGEKGDQEGKRVLDALRVARFVPVIFYTGFAEKISSLKTGVVKVVTKGSDGLQNLREAAREIFATGLPSLMRHIENEKRDFIWDTVDRHWDKVGVAGSSEDLAYLLARRLANRFNRDTVKAFLNHKAEAARPIEMYIYPPLSDTVKTGSILEKDADGTFWVVATPACDFAQAKADKVLLVAASPLADDARYVEWRKGKWTGDGKPPNNSARDSYEKLKRLFKNSAGDRYWFLPGTFFLPDLIIDLQKLKQIDPVSLNDAVVVCCLDSPYREEFLLRLSRYYGRLGTPDLEVSEIFGRLAG
ncbi:response regulator [Rhodanobacter sp. A1T4]|uniref:response regulator n=1 Tax=Rhodanobacter sp. A1T4 TaxID=2723087 RepID=UPI00160CAFDB|nr:response regulator [Rhodanobacter sp. A1T4]MBB6247739.1 CheY-like chemotaxis protein [Rhodanobacter sp. A1T4]